MKAKYKMTGCARFLIFLIILIPIAYFGSKFLRESGTWDKIKEKVENSDSDRSSVERTLDEKRERIQIPTNDSELTEQFEKLRAAYEEQELLLAKQDQTIQNLKQENDALRKRLNDPLTGKIPPSSTQPPVSSNPSESSDSPSLEDLLQEADSNLGTSSESGNANPSGSSRTTLGQWDFNYSGASGVIEFYRQDNKLFSRITIQGDNRINIEELTRSDNRFSVRNSKSGEYYFLLNNGNLEAYDQNGYQTTCIRK